MSSESEEEAKKLVSVLATFMPATGIREKAVETTETVSKDGKESKGNHLENLVQVLCIWYPITFWTKSISVSGLFDSGSEVNAIYPTFARELGLSIRTTDIWAYKIDGTTLDTYGIVIAVFSLKDKANLVRFFKETFLVTNISLEIVFGMLFLNLTRVYIDFLDWEL